MKVFTQPVPEHLRLYIETVIYIIHYTTLNNSCVWHEITVGNGNRWQMGWEAINL